MYFWIMAPTDKKATAKLLRSKARQASRLAGLSPYNSEESDPMEVLNGA